MSENCHQSFHNFVEPLPYIKFKSFISCFPTITPLVIERIQCATKNKLINHRSIVHLEKIRFAANLYYLLYDRCLENHGKMTGKATMSKRRQLLQTHLETSAEMQNVKGYKWIGVMFLMLVKFASHEASQYKIYACKTIIYILFSYISQTLNIVVFLE